ncbi:MAG: ATP-dependent helicase [Chloroflexi bacterium]|nr:MAG: ATP-dependent helicase [Chloroflexota bacterium]
MTPEVWQLLDGLAPDQRSAATAPGPVLCVAPAGSGKTTTLVARIAWLLGRGVDPATVCAITFNKRAAEELERRITSRLGAEVGAGVRVRTFHALGREILVDAGRPVEPLVDRMGVLRRLFPGIGPAGWRRLDDAFSRLKLDLQVSVEEVAADPSRGPMAETFVRYEAELAVEASLDFDDLVARALRLLAADPGALSRWRSRCAELLVDEVQDVDRSQLELALLLAAPANRIFLVGDDDQSIYGWRLADVRRVLSLAAALPGLRRFDLQTNYRCPAPVVSRSVRLVSTNRERFTKIVRAREGAAGRLVLAPDSADDPQRIRRALVGLPDDGSTRAILTRTNRELLPAVTVALELGLAFRAPRIPLLLDAPELDTMLDVARQTRPELPLLLRLGAVRQAMAIESHLASEVVDDEGFDRADLVAALLAWAPGFATFEELDQAVAVQRLRLAELRRDDADLTLATVHSTKGLEFDHVIVIGLDAGRFPSARALAEAADPVRALEEERRLAYVAWTRARRSLTLVYDPAAPSRFMVDAFDPAELGLEKESAA